MGDGGVEVGGLLEVGSEAEVLEGVDLPSWRCSWDVIETFVNWQRKFGGRDTCR